jgi:hypothetical protein
MEWKPDDYLKLFVLIGAAVAFVVGLMQYRRAQQWKRAEWVAQEMKALFGDPIVQAALLMIEWSGRRIALYPDRQAEADRYVRLTNESVADALMIHTERADRPFTDVEADVRAAFDRFLDGLERFHSYVETGLVELSDLRPYLKYWAAALRQPRDKGHRLARLTAYMRAYGYEGALDLLERIAVAEAARAAAANPAPGN